MPQERLTVRKIKEIMRLKYEAGLSNRAVAGACKVSNSTVGEYLRRARSAGVGWPLNDVGEEELYVKLFPEKQKVPLQRKQKMPDWEEVQKEKRRKGVTLQLLWQEYKEKNPDGYQYTQYCYHYQQWRKKQVEPAYRFAHKGGEQMQVDYAGVKVAISDPESGVMQKASVFVAILPASNYIYAEAHLGANQCNWNNAHVRALEYFGGVVKIVIPDNLRTGVSKPNYYEPDINPAYQELAEYYQFAVLPARVRKPRDKGAGENAVQQVERWILAPLRKRQFFSLYEANTAIKELLKTLNQKPMQSSGKSRREEFEEIDQPNLRPLPVRRYEYAERKTAKVNLDYHIAFEKHLYSVPYALIHQKVDIRASERMIEVFHHGKSVAVHPRSFQQGRYSTRPEHLPPNHRFMNELNAESFIQWATSIGPQTKQLITATLKSRTYPEQAYRTCLGILELSNKYPFPLMEQACQSAQEARFFSYKVIKQELTLLQQQDPQPILETLPGHEYIRGADYYKEKTLS